MLNPQKKTTFLTHYYKKGEKPFQSLSYLGKSEALSVIQKYNYREAEVYKRFQSPRTYLDDRAKVERWLRDEFIRKGGEPQKRYPHYLVLGESSYIYEGYNKDCELMRIPISDLDPKAISFTYSDSMVSYWLSTKKNNEIFFNSSLHGRVFTLDEIPKILSRYPFEDKIWESDEKQSYNFFIEAQVWSDDLLGFI